jgi:lipopolysaccharide export system protein LptA
MTLLEKTRFAASAECAAKRRIERCGRGAGAGRLAYTGWVMAVSIPRLRIWFGVLALAAVAVVGGFYVRARLELREVLRNLPGKVGVDIQQTSEGFTLSKSEGGRTLFTIHASKATQFKLGGRAELHDVRIIVYGRRSDRFDQIYGSDFEYDQKAGTVASKGEVEIDLEAGTGDNTVGQRPDDKIPPGSPEPHAPHLPTAGKYGPPADVGHPSAPGEMKNPIHLRVEGMVFNQKTARAECEGRVEFRVPQASGTARGAAYDAKKNELTLRSEVDIQTEGRQPTHIQAHSGAITKEPRVLTMESVQMSGASRTLLADEVIAHLAADNSVERVNAVGNVRMSDAGGMQLRAPKGELLLGAKNVVKSALFSGGVDFESGKQGTGGHSGEMRMQFASRLIRVRAARRSWGTQSAREAKPKAGSSTGTLLQTIYASHEVILRQAPREGSTHPQALAMTSNAMTFAMSEGKQSEGQQLSSAQTEGPGELTIRAVDPKSAGAGENAASLATGTGQRTALRSLTPGENGLATGTVIDAQHFTAEFGEENRLRTVHGTGAVQVTSRAPGQADKVSTSETMVAEFSPSGEISRAVQEGNFRYREGQSSKGEPGGRSGTAARASYSPLDESLTLAGDPRVVDGGMTVTGDTIRLLRSGGELFAVGNVKTSYSELTVQPNGALLATSDPVHVTAHAMNARQSSGLAHYTGGARLWQGSNIVEAQTIDFDQKARSIAAQGDSRRPVSSVFVQVDGKGKSSLMVVTAPRLDYADSERQARYSGGVTAKGADGVMTAGRADIFLNAAGAAHTPGPSQLDHIIASTHVLVQQKERRAEGEKLVYQASNGSFVMSGGSPTLSDPVNGTVGGDSLTFYSHDDRVVVEGGGSSRAVTHTHVSH